MSGIYKILNKSNNKCYIGSTVNFSNRKYLHFSRLKRGRHHSIILQRAYDKYGIDNFQFIILEECKNDNLLEREQYYFDKYHPEYNIAKIAGNNLGVKSTRRIPIIQYDLDGNKIKIWDCLEDIKKELNLSASSKISECCKLKRNKSYGFVWRYFENNSEFSLCTTRKGKCIAEIDNNKNIINVWERIIDCANDIGTSSAAICNLLSEKSRRKTINNRMFKRIEKEELEQYRYLIKNS